MNIFYPDNLPIIEQRDAIIAALRNQPSCRYCRRYRLRQDHPAAQDGLEAFPDSNLLIGCTQPRRIAASTVAARVAEELGPLGDAGRL